MNSAAGSLKSWLTFAGIVLVIGVLKWGEAVLVPVALAAVLAFLLARPVTWLERSLGRVSSVLVVVTLVFLALGLAGWGLMRQMDALADDLPAYRKNITAKVADIRGASRGGTVEKLQTTIEGIKTDIDKMDPPARGTPRSVVLQAVRGEELSALGWFGPFLGPLGTAGLVIALVIFMLLERRDLRDRLIRLAGHGSLPVTTRAFSEASARVSRQLLMQSLVNAAYGAAAATGLYFLDVPYPFLWGVLAAFLRFIPYLGPVLGAGAPIFVSLAAQPAWSDALLVIGLFVVLEVFTNLVLEPILYAGAAGVSQVALLISLAFWTWLWGPVGLLLATPLTACLVVLGKHVPGLAFFGTLMADTPALEAEYGYYQRLLARDPGEAAALIERHIRSEPPGSVYDALLIPALNYAERDRLEKRLSVEDESAVINLTRELLADVTNAMRQQVPAGVAAAESAGQALASSGGRQSLQVLGHAVNGPSDEVALTMLSQAIGDLSVAIEVSNTRLLASELVALVRERGVAVVCLVDLPPSSPLKTRYLVKHLHSALPGLHIVVGRWSTPGLADESTQALRDAGATMVATTIAETRAYLEKLVQVPCPLPQEIGSADAARS
jgi:predicted PurR-regulated permease PerM